MTDSEKTVFWTAAICFGALCVAVLLGGCATASFNEITPDGTQTAVNYTVFAPPFATAVADQSLNYEAFDEWRLQFGQNA